MRVGTKRSTRTCRAGSFRGGKLVPIGLDGTYCTELFWASDLVASHRWRWTSAMQFHVPPSELAGELDGAKVTERRLTLLDPATLHLQWISMDLRTCQ